MSLFFFGCSNSSKPLTPEEVAFIKKNESIAYGDLKFGMDSLEVKKIDLWEVGIKEHKFRVIEMLDHNKELYKVLLLSPEKSANYLENDVKLAYLDLNLAIQDKYGDPNSLRDYPNILQLRTGYTYECAEWEIGKKRIEISVYNSKESKFQIWCEIYDEARLKAYRKHQNEIDSQQIEADSENS